MNTPNTSKTRGWSRLFSWLDFKLGFRMLARYPGLTLVGTIAMTIAIALGTMYYEGVNKFLHPRLPIPDASRVVSIYHWDRSHVEPESPLLSDFAMWREQIRTVENLGAAVLFERNLATPDGRVDPVRGAELTANAFRLMGTRPLMGRTLTEQDERPTEPPVVVISHWLWQTRFASDPAILDRTIKLGTVDATIVGVMPEGFGFPETQRIWTPLRTNVATLAPRTGPRVRMFGRLAPGVSQKEAQAEVDAIGARMATAYSQMLQHLKPRVAPYAKPLLEGREGRFFRGLLTIVNGIFLMLLAVVSVNIATLVFARTATRGWEITVRSALGASRGRIITQLFIEALVLAGLAAVAGLAVARYAMGYVMTLFGGSDAIPFYMDNNLSPKTVLYTGLLTLFGAAIVGILPALRVTKLNVLEALRNESAARSGLRFGGFWTTVIVVQVAVTVAFMPLAAGGVFKSNRFRERAAAIGAEGYLTASVSIDRENHALDSATFAGRARNSFDELERRLGAEPDVEQITFADRLPVMDQVKYGIEVDTIAGAPTGGIHASTLVNVSRGYFDAFGTSVVAGRDFAPLDFETGNVLIVNESFARNVFGGRNVIGQAVRIASGNTEEVLHSAAGDTWYEIIGVVKDFGWQPPEPHEQSAMYRPRLPTADAGTNLAVRVRDPNAFAIRLRTIAASVDPTMRLFDVQPLARVGGDEARRNWALTSIAWLIAFIVLTLSATGIHSLMSFTVARRTREIGIRAALGAEPRRIVAGIFKRAFLQIGAGILAGSALAAVWGLGSTREVLLLLGADVVMLVVGLAACWVPLTRALSIHPTEALRAEG